MGRTYGALARPNPVDALAQWLESLRQRSGKSWDQMARTAVENGVMVSRSTLHRAAQGATLPKWRTVQAFTRVCGGDEREAKRLWSRADRCNAASARGELRIAVPRPQFITEPWQLIHAMKDMYRENGNPTLRELEKRAYIDAKNKVSLLPRSTVGAVLRGRMPSKELLLNFVRYCGDVPESRIQEWEDAWDRVDAYNRGELSPGAAQTQARARALAQAQAQAQAQDKLTQVEEELKHTREQLEQATAELTRAGHPARRVPASVVRSSEPAGRVPPPARPKKTVLTAGPPPPTKRRGHQRRGVQSTIRAR